MLSITAVILTYNEEKHIARCINNVRNIAERIYVIDSYSTDRTCEIAVSLGAEVVQHKFVNQAQQLQWALDTCEINSRWIFRLDADEYLSDKLIREIKEVLPSLPADIKGCDIPRDVIFMGKHLKWGKCRSIRLMRLWRNGAAYVEQRWMDEHCILKSGSVYHLRSLFFDDNKNGLTAWIDKHNKYANREIVVILNDKYSFWGKNEVMRIRNNKKGVYYSLPLFLRSYIYFFVRYICLLGFLDGAPGLVWHTLQAFWYRFIIDAKLKEMYREVGERPAKQTIIEYISKNYNLEI